MGNTAGIQGESAEKDPRVLKGWKSTKVRKLRLGLNAVCRFTHEINELYSDSRREREPWKSILENAADEFEEERRLQAEEENTESTDAFYLMMMGIIPEKHIKRQGRECWVFVSSTFTDTRHERDMLMEDVYPYVRDYCREIGLSFNVVDFRWGIRKTACNQHLAAQICLKEVQRCRENSVGPFFVGILGQKYGFRPIPYTLQERVFYTLMSYISNLAEQEPQMKEAKRLLEQWFKIDTNALDCIAVLQPIDDIYPMFSQNDPTAVGKWKHDFSVMQAALFTAIKGSQLPPDLINELTWSVTEGEIIEGMKDLDPSEPDRMFLFNRLLSNFHESMESARNFIDQSQNGEIDADAQIKLQELRQKLREKIPQNATHRYKLRFLESNDEMINDESNKEQLRKFLDQFCQYMIDSIREGALAEATALDHIDYSEVLMHVVFCRERAEIFVGRSVILQTISSYLEQPHGKKPFAIHGEGGTGKSAIIGKMFSIFAEKYGDSMEERPIMVIRFIGITPDSSNIRDLLLSICLQLCYCLHLDVSKLPREYKAIENKFYEMLNLATAEKPIMIFLDALDQLTNENEAHDLNWLRSSLTEHVHLIVTVRPAAGAAFARYRKMGNSDYSLEVIPMDEEDRMEMIELRLKKLGRCITESQMDYVKSAYGRGQPPALYLRLACDIASQWRSYTPMSKCKLANGTMGIIEQRFIELEANHGQVFVSHALGYLSASQNGLSPNELLDVLSCDEDVLEDVFQYHVPPIRRLPVLLWTRLRLDLGDYLVESGADKMVVYRWYHRLFYVVAKNRYLIGVNGQRIHESLAQYFLGRWANTPKPYRIKGTKQVEVTHRRVQDQPLVIDASRDGGIEGEQTPRPGNKAGKIRYNMRKLSELPHHLIEGCMWKEAVEVMCSIPWCEAKCATGRIFQLLEELSQAATKCSTDHQHALGCFYRMIRANSQLLQKHPELLCQQALNEPDASLCVTFAKKYCKTRKNVQYWADLSKSQAPDPEVMTFTHSAPVTTVSFSPQCKHLAVACDNSTLKVWRVASGAIEMTVEDIDVTQIAWPQHCFWLAVLQTGGIKIYGLGTGKEIGKGELVCSINCEVEPIAKVYIPKQSKQLFLASHGRVEIYNTSTGRQLQKYNLRCRPKAMDFSPNGKFLVIAYNTSISICDYTKGDMIKEFDIPERVNNFKNTILAYSKDNKYIMGILPIGSYKWKVSGKNGKPEGYKMSINCLPGPAVLSPDLDFIATLEGEIFLKVLRMKPSVEWCQLDAHKEAVTCADFGTTSKYLLLATGSDDHMVRLWDAGSFTGYVTCQNRNHTGKVTGCVFSPDGSRAVSSSADCAWLWDVTTTPPRVCLNLVPKTSCGELKKIVCTSDGGEFVVGLCNETDIYIWNTKCPTKADFMTVECEHRMMPFVNPQYFFLTFNKNALLACFTTSNKFGVLFLCEVFSQSFIQEWKNNPERTPSYNEYCPNNLLEFDHTSNYKIMDAAIRDDGEQIVTVTKKLAELSLLDTITAPKKQQYEEGEVFVNVWNVKNREVIFKCTVANKLTRFHCVEYLMDYPMVFMQEEFKQTNITSNSRPYSRGGVRVRQEEAACYTVTRILDSETGDTLGKLTIPGDYDTLKVPSGHFFDGQISLQDAMGMIMISCRTKDGVFKCQNLNKNSPMAKFVLKSSMATAYGYSSDNQSAMVGFDTGAVRFLRLVNSKGKTFLGNS